MILVDPGEPRALRAIGTESSSIEAKYGADGLIVTQSGVIAIQRKALTDLPSAIRDGRLARQCQLMCEAATLGVLLIEGRLRWGPGDVLVEDPSFKRDELRSVLWSVQARGIWLCYTDDLSDTIKCVESLHRWAEKKTHTSLSSVPNMRGQFGLPPTDIEQKGFVLVAVLPGLGPVKAHAILQHFGGSLKRVMNATVEELCEVRGVGKPTALKIVAAFE